VLQGVGGIVELAPGYLPAVYSSIKKAGGLCIADEVQAGFGRTGSHFWGFETQGVVPDIVTMAKVLFSLLLFPSFFLYFGSGDRCP
jgi:alanine-glyoxylate transaminase/(R)-3-amino-2-methylpropionate-pyruvate transaminase